MVRNKKDEVTERVVVTLFRTGINNLTMRELEFLEGELVEVFLILKSPLNPKVLIRRYGFTVEELAYLKNNQEKVNKGIQKAKKNPPTESENYPRERVLEMLEENKKDIVMLIKDKVKPLEVLEQMRIFPYMSAWNDFRNGLIEDGYIAKSGSRGKKING